MAEDYMRDWPDADARAERRAKLHTDLDTFLDTFIDDDGEGGWAKATNEHVGALDDIVREIIDLKFKRDEDGDQTILPRFDNRRFGRMVDVVIPHEPDGREVTPLDYLRYQSELMSALSMMASIMHTQTNMLNSRMSREVYRQDRDQQIDDLTQRLRELVAHGEREPAMTILNTLLGTRDFNPLIPKGDPRVEEVRKFRAILDATAVAEHRKKLDAALKAYEAGDPLNKEAETEMHKTMAASYELFGKAVFERELARYEAIGTVRRRARFAAKEARA
jgi:hypothetical protein